MNKQSRKLPAVLLLLFISITMAFPQVTTSGMNGKIHLKI